MKNPIDELTVWGTRNMLAREEYERKGRLKADDVLMYLWLIAGIGILFILVMAILYGPGF